MINIFFSRCNCSVRTYVREANDAANDFRHYTMIELVVGSRQSLYGIRLKSFLIWFFVRRSLYVRVFFRPGILIDSVTDGGHILCFCCDNYEQLRYI